MDESRVGFLRRLIESPSPSGFEQPIQEVIRTEISQYTDVVRTDVHGNVIASLNPEGSPRRPVRPRPRLADVIARRAGAPQRLRPRQALVAGADPGDTRSGRHRFELCRAFHHDGADAGARHAQRRVHQRAGPAVRDSRRQMSLSSSAARSNRSRCS